MKTKLKAIDFFCGAGGMSSGMAKAGINVLAGVDFDKSCEATYLANHKGSEFIHADIKELSFQDLESRVEIGRNDDNMVFIGCSPCQYWTKMNTIKTKSSESKNLLEDFQRFVNHYNPGHIVVENVPGIFNNQKESPLPAFLEFLAERNYITVYKTINAHNYGIPQNRRRFVLIASRVNENLQFPEESNERPVVADVLKSKKFYNIPAGHKDKTDFLHTSAGLSETNIRRLKKITTPGGTRLAWANDPDLQIPAYEGNDNRFTDVYGRMWWDKPSPTITTKFYSVSNGRFAHPEQHRAISLREGALLQTFDEDYRFVGNGVGQIARQIGNAVPPQLARKIGIALTTN